MAWQNPKTDWDTNPKSPMAEDFNRIEENIDFLNSDIETKKGAIVDAINTMGRSVTMANTHTELAIAIKDISDDATAAEGDVLSNKTFYQGGIKRTGTMANLSLNTNFAPEYLTWYTKISQPSEPFTYLFFELRRNSSDSGTVDILCSDKVYYGKSTNNIVYQNNFTVTVDEDNILRIFNPKRAPVNITVTDGRIGIYKTID